MISVVVYGRNDTHGYNHHRRVALSLNCLAEVLTDPDDEIIFVDYNTPDELPTAVEALADTLTHRCLGLLRVLRVPASVHTERYSGRTHLGLVEPVARNAAARRANPSNRWVLSTNTDMILVPLQGDSLSEVCRDLPDGYYGLPRFELPEWVWERLPRTDPRRALAEVERLGPALYLDEPTLSDKWVRFDAPGDFQLVLRDDFFAIDGFDEEMLLGWHLDSNLSRRMRLHRGSIETLQDGVAGYHCNHSRIPTVYHGAERISNDLDRFFYSLEGAALPAQRATWGLADVALEEVALQRQIGPAFVDALLATLPIASGARPPSDAVKAAFGTTYDSGHVLPFIADSLVVSPLTTIGYLGINPILREMLARLVEEMGLGCKMTVAELTDPNDVDEFAQSADLFVVDLGTDLSLAEAANVVRLGDQSAQVPAGLDLVFAALERLVEVERARLGLGAHPRRVVLVNSSTIFLDEYALAEFDCSSTTVHCRVRRATVKALADESSKAAVLRARRFARWALGRGDSGPLRLAPGNTVRFADLDDHVSLSAGWAFPDEGGVWTWGSRSELLISAPQVDDGDCLLTFLINGVCVAPDEALRVELLVDSVRVATRDFSQSDASSAWRVELPPGLLSAGSAKLTIAIDEPRSPLAVGWSADDRPLGLHLRSLTLGALDHSVQPQQPILFGEGSDGERLLAEGWSWPDPTGVWTDGGRARLILGLQADPLSEAVLVLDVVPFLTPEHAELTVDVWAHDTQLVHRVFRDDDLEGRLVLRLPPSVRDDRGRTVVDFHLQEPARPVDLGVSSDPRRLGLHLNSLTFGDVDHSVRPQQCVVFGEGSNGERLLAGGWSWPDPTGVWTDGNRARLILELKADPLSEAVLVLDVVPFLTSEHAELTVDVRSLDTDLAHRVFRSDDLDCQLVLRLPPSVRDENGGTVVDFHLHDPASPFDMGVSSDPRRLGLHLNSLTLGEVDRSLAVGQAVSFIEGSDSERFLGVGWSELEPTGVWTIAHRAKIILQLPADAGTDLELVLGSHAYITPGHPELDVVLTSRNERLGARRFRRGVRNRFVPIELIIPLTSAVVDTEGRVVVDVEIGQPVSPQELGLSGDTRLLGLHLKWLMVRRAGGRRHWDAVRSRLRRANPRRRAGEAKRTT